MPASEVAMRPSAQTKPVWLRVGRAAAAAVLAVGLRTAPAQGQVRPGAAAAAPELMLPSAAAADQAPDRPGLVIALDRNGQTCIGPRRAGIKLLHRYLREAAPAAARISIRLDADRRVSWEHVGRLIELLHFEGFGEVSIGVRVAPAGGQETAKAEGARRGPGAPERTAVVAIDRGGRAQVDGEAVSAGTLGRALRKALAEDGGARVELRAERRTPLQYVVGVLDECRRAGIAEVSFRYRPMRVRLVVPAAPDPAAEAPPAAALRERAATRLAVQVKRLAAQRDELHGLRDKCLAVLLDRKLQLPEGWRTAARGPEVGPDEPSGKGVAELYRSAAALEKASIELADDICAAALTVLENRRLSMPQARGALARPARPAADAALLGEAAPSAARLPAFRDHLDALATEAELMLPLAGKVARLAEAVIAEKGGFSKAGPVGPVLLGPAPKAPRWVGAGSTPVGGRRLMSLPPGTDWVYLDAWYIIGPFPNPDRRRIDGKFLPEVLVDLDAAFPGRPGRQIRWQYNLSETLLVQPPVVDNYSVWYAWTEVYVDEDQHRWMLFASDDFGRAWVNGEPVWHSGKIPHPWVPDRGTSRVRLRKGCNEVLFKLENAGGTTGFSVMIDAKPAAAPAEPG